ncbi:MAG: DMT family transporter [Chloroflexota bacterium]
MQPSHNTPVSATILPYLLLMLAIIGLGFSPIFIKWADAPGTVTNFYRMSIGVVALAWPFIRRVQREGVPQGPGVWIAILGGVLFAVELSAWAAGVLMSGASNPTMLANTAPVWVGLGAVLIFKERLSGLFWLGLVLAISGAAVILGVEGIRSFQTGSNTLLGTSLGLVAAVLYGGYLLITQWGRTYLDLISYFWIATVSSMVTLLLFILIFGHPLTGYSTMTYLNFFAFGLMAQVFGYLAINYALGHLPASIVSPSLLGQAVLTVIYANLFLGEALTIWQVIGIMAVILGVLLVHRGRES